MSPSNSAARPHQGQWVRRVWQRIGSLFPTGRQWRALAAPFGRASAWLPKYMGAHLKAWWRQTLTDENRQFLSNLFAGLAIGVVLNFMEGSRVLNALEDIGLDWMIAMQGSTSSASDASMTWIDIDERTYQEWQEPLHIPRQHVRTLLEFAAESEANVVIVDVDLATRSSDATGDESLRSYLQEFSGRCMRQQATACPHIILARSFRRALPGGAWQERRSFLDPAVATMPQVHWGSPLYLRSKDWLIRGARPWQTTCQGDQARPIPAVHLLTRCLLRGEPADGLSRALQAHEAGACDASGRLRASPRSRKALHVCGLDIDEAGSRVANRIVFAAPWSATTVTAQLDEAEGPRNRRGAGSRSLGWLTTLSAASILHADTQPVSKELLKGRVVVIGGSFDASGDLHPTPLGPMPGALIMANAIHSLDEHGQIRRPSLWKLLPWEAFCLFLTSIPFVAFKSFFGMFWSSLLALSLSLPLSLLLFSSGSWVSFLIPLVGVQLHRLISALEHTGKRGHHV